MTITTAALDLRPFEAELNALLLIAQAAGPGVGSVVLEHARSLLQRFRALPVNADVDTDAAEAAGEWTALRRVIDPAALQIDCSLALPGAECLLFAHWQDQSLLELLVRVGDALWAERHGDHGERRFSSDNSLEGAADRRWFQQLPERAQALLERWQREHPDQRWHCPRCAFQNGADAAYCAVCGALPSGAAGGNEHGWHPAVEPRRNTIEPLRAGVEMALPDGLDDWLADITGLAAAVVRSGQSRSAGAAKVDVVLLEFDLARRSALVKVLMAERARLNLQTDSLAQVLDLLATLPALVASDLSPNAAAPMREALERAGARIELRGRQ